MYTCPVCGYDRLHRPPANFVICPSCGTEFGYSDSVANHEQLQSEWLLRGGHWHSNVTPPPVGWDRDRQLANLDRVSLAADTKIPAHIDAEPTVTTPGRVEVAGQIVPSDQARFSSAKITIFWNIADLVTNVRPLHA